MTEHGRIGEISDLVTKGTTPTTIGRRFTHRGIKFIKVETVAPDGHFIVGREAHIDPETNAILRRSQLAEGDILFSIAGALGRSTIVDASWLPANTNQAFAIIRPSRRRKDVDPQFLLWQLRGPIVARTIAEINVQAAQANLSLAQVRNLEIPIAPLPEQRAIARVLDDVNGYVAVLKRLIAKKEALKQGIMKLLLTGTSRLPGFSDSWQESAIADLTDIVSGGTPKSSVPAYWDGDIMWCTPTDITREPSRYLRKTERKISRSGLRHSAARLLPTGSLLLCTRATIGEIKIASCPVATNQGFKSLVPKHHVSNEFLYYKMLMLKEMLFGLGTGSTFLEVSKRDVAGLRLDVPPLEEQAAIATVLTNVDNEIDALRVRLAKAKAIKQGMMQQLLMGRTRLPVMDEVTA